MATQEKRKHARFSSLNLSYVCLDENNQIIKQGMGRTLNVSESGILLETHFPIDKSHIVTLTWSISKDVRYTYAQTQGASTKWASSLLNPTPKPAGHLKNLLMHSEDKTKKTNDLIWLRIFYPNFPPIPWPSPNNIPYKYVPIGFFRVAVKIFFFYLFLLNITYNFK